MLRPLLLLLASYILFASSLNGYAQTVRISEVMADNGSSLLDEDSESPDWIELYNTSSNTVDLTGWYITDNALNLTQWQFPATNIAANGFLILFASNKDRAVGGQELHTNFKLSASGEEVVLVQSDGSTIEDQIAFSTQQEDISFGYGFNTGAGSVLLDAGDACKAHVPTSSSDASGWKVTGFNDAGWMSGTTGVGYDTGTRYLSLIGLDMISMLDVNASVYIRVPFTVNSAATVSNLRLKMKYDDGFVAYINGTQVAISTTAPASPSWDSASDDGHADYLAEQFEEYDISAHSGALQDGQNMLAIHGMNYGAGSTDLLFVPRLEGDLAGGINLSETGLLTTPTPGAPNDAINYEGYVETPITSPGRGFYDSSVLVSVSNITQGATVRYTLDGSEPTASSTQYTSPITISSTKNLRVRAFRTDWKPSIPRTDTYIFVDDVVTQPKSYDTINGQDMEYGMNSGVVSDTHRDSSNALFTVQDALKAIPTISITTDDDNLYSPASGIYVNAAERWERPASVELLNPDGTEGFHINAGLRIRGGWSRHPDFPKHAFRLFFRDIYGDGKLKYDLFEDEGVGTFAKVDLRTAQNYNWAKNNDARNTFLRDIMTRDSAGAMGDEYTRSRYYHLYLNGLYWGLFMTEERPEANFGESYCGGNEDDYDVIKVRSWTDFDSYSIEATSGTLDAYNRLHAAAMNGFANNADYFSIQGLDASGMPDPANEKLLDVENMIDYLLLIYYSAASDNGITKFITGKLNNLYAIYNRATPDGFKWVQHDCEHAYDTTTEINRTGPYNNSNYDLAKFFNAQTLHDRLVGNAEYRMKFADRVYKHYLNGGALVRTNSQARLDFRAAQIDRAIVANAARWSTTSRDRDNWLTAVSDTRNWLGRSGDRCNEVIDYLDDDGLIPSINPPQLSIRGGLVSPGTTVNLTTSQGTIYYTVDGTDPRAIGGSIAGSSYGAPITINRPTHLKARARSGSTWSALAEGTFWTEDIPLAVTELMYHAPDGNPHDFIEIQNISSEPVTLRGYKLDNAIDFKFKTAAQTSLAAGEYLVAVDDIDAFSSTYPTSGINIAGEYDEDFNNGGEEVDLEFRNNDLISFNYSDARNWPQAADGAGHSLVPLDSAMANQERGSLDYGGNWRASTYTNGSPGYADPTEAQSIALNEITAHTDTGLSPPFDSNDKIELYNPTTSPITLNGWYLSDDRDNLTKFAIPNGTTIQADSFLLFDEDDFHPGRTNGFGLNKAGEQVYLSSSDRVVDAIRFKGQENGASLGRYPDGASDWIMTIPTPEAPNQPVAPSIQISRLMYNPLQPGDDYEYIQLKNVGSGSVSLENSTGPYRIDGGVDFDFPAGVTLGAGETLWILSFNPTNTAKLNLFCAEYGLNVANETFFGGYKGELSDRAERVALERPQDSDDPLRPLDISWVVVDEVFYFDQSPWPSNTDGTGNPLIRTDLTTWSAPSATDTDADGMDDTWEIDYFGTLDPALNDMDDDGQSNLEEFIADTNPTNSESYFIIESMTVPTITWTPKTDRTYSVYWSDSMDAPFTLIASDLTVGSYTDSAHTNYNENFYRIVVEKD